MLRVGNDREWQRSTDDDWNVEVCEWRNNGDDGGGGEKEFSSGVDKELFRLYVCQMF